jgi:uncharacterized protein YndB with AHSA1/START domain
MPRDLHLRRVYDATPQQLWDAWTRPEQLARWWGKRGWTAKPGEIVLDVRPGGTFRVTTVNDEDGSEMTNAGTYDEVQEPHRLTFGETVVTFTALEDGRTEMTFHTTTEAQDELFKRMQSGVESAFERLEEALR